MEMNAYSSDCIKEGWFFAKTKGQAFVMMFNNQWKFLFGNGRPNKHFYNLLAATSAGMLYNPELGVFKCPYCDLARRSKVALENAMASPSHVCGKVISTERLVTARTHNGNETRVASVEEEALTPGTKLLAYGSRQILVGDIPVLVERNVGGLKSVDDILISRATLGIRDIVVSCNNPSMMDEELPERPRGKILSKDDSSVVFRTPSEIQSGVNYKFPPLSGFTFINLLPDKRDVLQEEVHVRSKKPYMVKKVPSEVTITRTEVNLYEVMKGTLAVAMETGIPLQYLDKIKKPSKRTRCLYRIALVHGYNPDEALVDDIGDNVLRQILLSEYMAKQVHDFNKVGLESLGGRITASLVQPGWSGVILTKNDVIDPENFVWAGHGVCVVQGRSVEGRILNALRKTKAKNIKQFYSLESGDIPEEFTEDDALSELEAPAQVYARFATNWEDTESLVGDEEVVDENLGVPNEESEVVGYTQQEVGFSDVVLDSIRADEDDDTVTQDEGCEVEGTSRETELVVSAQRLQAVGSTSAEVTKESGCSTSSLPNAFPKEWVDVFLRELGVMHKTSHECVCDSSIGGTSVALFLKPFLKNKSLGCRKCWNETPFNYGRLPGTSEWAASVASLREFGGTSTHLASVLENALLSSPNDRSFIESFLTPLEPRLMALAEEVSRVLGTSRRVQEMMEDVASRHDVGAVKQVLSSSMRMLNEQIDGRFQVLKGAFEVLQSFIGEQLSMQQFYYPHPTEVEKLNLDSLRDDEGNPLHKVWMRGYLKVVCDNGVGVVVPRSILAKSQDVVGRVRFPGHDVKTSGGLLALMEGVTEGSSANPVAEFLETCKMTKQSSDHCAVMFEGVRKFGCMKAPGATFVTSTIFPMINHIRYGNLYHSKAMHFSVGSEAMTNLFQDGFCYMQIFAIMVQFVPNSQAKLFLDQFIPEVVTNLGKWPTFDRLTLAITLACLRFPHVTAAPVPIIIVDHSTETMHVVTQFGVGDFGFHQLHIPTVQDWYDNAQYVQESAMRKYVVGGVMRDLGKCIKSRSYFLEFFQTNPEMVVETLLSPSKINVLYRAEQKHHIISQLADEEPRLVALLARINTLGKSYDLFEDMKFVMDHFLRENLTLREPIEILYGAELAYKFGNNMGEIIAQNLEFSYVDKLEKIIEKNLGFEEREQDMRIMMRTLIFDSSSFFERLLVRFGGGYTRICAGLRANGVWLEQRLPKPQVRTGMLDILEHFKRGMGKYTGMTAFWACRMAISKIIPYYVVISLLALCASVAFRMVKLVQHNKLLVEQAQNGGKELVVQQHKRTAGKVTAQFMAWAAIITALFNTDLSDQWYTCMQRFKTIMSTLFDEYVTTQANSDDEGQLDFGAIDPISFITVALSESESVVPSFTNVTFEEWLKHKNTTNQLGVIPKTQGVHLKMNSLNISSVANNINDSMQADFMLIGKVGSGKSTKFIKELNSHGSILLCEPTRALVSNVEESLGVVCEVDASVRMRFHHKAGSNSVTVMTYGFALNWFASGVQNLDDFTFVCFDESHILEANMIVFYNWIRMRDPGKKIIKMSATPSNHATSFEPEHPVEVKALKSCSIANFMKEQGSGTAMDVSGCGRVVLVFVASYNDVDGSAKCLREKGFQVITADGRTLRNMPNLNERISEARGDHVYVIATNAIENGVTLNVDVVVDFGEKIEADLDPEGRFMGTRRRKISLSERIQRLGRVGRFKPGVAVRVGSLEDSNCDINTTLATEAVLKSFAFNVPPCLINVDTELIKNYTKDQVRAASEFELDTLYMAPFVRADGKIPRPVFNEFKHLLLRETKLVICDKYATSIHSRGWRTVRQYVRDGRSRLNSECEIPIPFHHHSISDEALARLVEAMQNSDPGRGKGVKLPTIKLNEVLQTIQYNENKIPHILATIEACRDEQQRMLFNMRTSTSTFTASSLLNFVNLRFLANKKLLEAKYEENITILNELEQVVRSVPAGTDDTTLMEYLRDNPRLSECVLTESGLKEHIERKYLGKKPIVIGRLLVPCLIAINIVCFYYVYLSMKTTSQKELVVTEGKRNYNRDKRGDINFQISADREALGYDASVPDRGERTSKKKSARDEILELTGKGKGRNQARSYSRAPFKNVYDLEINTFDIVRFVDPDTRMAYSFPAKGVNMNEVVEVMGELNADLLDARNIADVKPDRLHAYFLRDGDEHGYFVNMTPHRSTRVSSKNPLLPIGYPEHNGEMRQTGPVVRVSREEMKTIGLELEDTVTGESTGPLVLRELGEGRLLNYNCGIIEELSRKRFQTVDTEARGAKRIDGSPNALVVRATDQLVADLSNCVGQEAMESPEFKNLFSQMRAELGKVAKMIAYKESCIQESKRKKMKDKEGEGLDGEFIMTVPRHEADLEKIGERFVEHVRKEILKAHPGFIDPKTGNLFYPSLSDPQVREQIEKRVAKGELTSFEIGDKTLDPNASQSLVGGAPSLVRNVESGEILNDFEDVVNSVKEDDALVSVWKDTELSQPNSVRRIGKFKRVKDVEQLHRVVYDESLTSIKGPRSFDHFKSYILLIDRGDVSQCGFGYGDWICMNTHFFRDIENQNLAQDSLYITSHLGRQAYSRKYLSHFHQITDHDCAVIPIPFESPKFKSKLRMRPPTQGEEVIILTPIMDSTGVSFKISQPSIVNWDPSYGTFWKHRITTHRGQCGSLVIGVLDDFVVGIHALGNVFNSGWNYFTPVTEQLKQLLAKPGHSGSSISYNVDMIDWGNLVNTKAIKTFPIVREIQEVVVEQSGCPGLKYLGGNLALRGYIDRPVNFKHVIKGVRSEFLKFIFGNQEFAWVVPLLSQRLPSVMSVESFYMDLLKYDKPTEVGFANEVYTKIAFDNVVEIMVQSGFEPGSLQYEWDTWEIVADMNKDSAMGACYHGKKSDWLSGLEDDEVLECHRESLLRLFEGKMGIWTGALKAELRPKEKVMAKKSRVFTAAPVDVLLGAKTVVDRFNHKFYELHENAPWTVGINKFNKGWDRLARRFRNKPGYTFICADGSQFDSSLNPYLFSLICDLRLIFMEPCFLGSTMLRNLYAQIVYTPISTVDGLIVKKFKGNNSGQPSTVVDNTLILMFVIEYSKVALKEEHGVELDLVYAINGDDVLSEVADHQLGILQEHFPRYFKHFGLNYTFEETYAAITDAHYMSCHFVNYDGVVIPKLTEERVIAIMEWERNEDLAAQLAALNAARIEAWGNPRLFKLADEFIDYFARSRHLKQYFYIPEELISTLYLKTTEEAKAVVLMVKERVGLESLEGVLSNYQLVEFQADEESWTRVEGYEPPVPDESDASRNLREQRNKANYEQKKGKQPAGSGSAADVPTGNTHAGRTAPLPLPPPPSRTVWVSPSMRNLVNANVVRQLAMYKPDQMLMRADVANQETMQQWQDGIAEAMGVQGDQLITLIQAFMVYCINSGTSAEVVGQEYWQADNGSGVVQVYPLKPFVVNAGKSLRAVMRNLSPIAEAWIKERNRKGTWFPVWASKGGLTDKNYAHVGFDFWIPSETTTSTELDMHGKMAQTHLSGKPPRDLAMVAMVDGSDIRPDYHSGSDTGRGRHNVRGATLN